MRVEAVKLPRASVVLLVLAGCREHKPPVVAAPALPASSSSTFADARKQYLEAVANFEAHVWDLDGTERRKALNALTEAGEKLAASPGRRQDLPAEALRRATRRVATEASAFSQKLNIQESIGKPTDQGLPWPYEYKDAVAFARCLLTEAQRGTSDKRQSFARLAAVVGVMETLSEDGPVEEMRAALTEPYVECSGFFANHKDLTHQEKELLRSVIDARFREEGSPRSQLTLGNLRQKLVELAQGH